MLPATIRRLIDGVHRRERGLDLCWAAARWLTLAAGLLVLACLGDWLIDRWRDTPWWLRVLALVGQLAVWVAGLAVLARLARRRPGDDAVALWLEERIPALGHRLISAVQLNRPGARTQGMSPDLIATVTHQAEGLAGGVQPAQVCDTTRLVWARRLLLPVLGLALVLFVLSPRTAWALLQRQLLADVDIPRSVALEDVSPAVLIAGEEGEVRFRASGPGVSVSLQGIVRLEYETGEVSRVELAHEVDDLFSARVPPSDVPFRFHAWLGDGRTRQPGQARYEPRPVVERLDAWVQLPASIGRRPDGKPYEEAQKGGDILHSLAGSKARVTVQAQKPVRSATLTVLGKARRTVTLRTAAAGRAEGVFDLTPGDSAYEVRIVDEYGFPNLDPPRRAIRLLPLEPPAVTLLPETFWKEGDTGSPEDREVEGIPVLLDRKVRLEYRCTHRYGISHVQLRYRVVPRGAKTEEDSGQPNLDAFIPLPLGPGRGAKGPISPRAREEFSTRPVDRPEEIPDTEGGGRYDLDTTGIPDGKGELLRLKEGDRIQFFVEAFSKADPDGTPGRSALREKEVVSLAAYLAWLERKDDLKERTRYLEEQQRAVRPGAPEK